MWNRHKESKIHAKHEIDSGTKLFITFELTVIRHEEREAQSFYADFSIFSHHVQYPAANYWSGLGEPRKSTFFLRGKNSTHCFFSNPKILSLRFRCVTSLTSPGLNFLSGIFILTSLNDTSSPRACTPALLHLTNPCAKWKVLILTKPKGMVYKTKSLRNYITYMQGSNQEWIRVFVVQSSYSWSQKEHREQFIS